MRGKVEKSEVDVLHDTAERLDPMNETHDLALEFSEPRHAEGRSRPRDVRPGSRHPVQGRVVLEQFDGELSPMRKQLIHEGRYLRDEGVGPFGRKPLHVNVSVIAFGFKHGIPLDLDLLFDVRFLRNPNYDPALQPRTGSDAAVAAFIERDPALAPFFSHLFPLLDFLLCAYATGGRESVRIGLGCTGGRHRSVYVAGRVGEHLRLDVRWLVSTTARDVEIV